MNRKPYIERLLGSERYYKWRDSNIYRFAVDTTASLIFYNAVNGSNELYHSTDPVKCLKTRAVGSVINVATARFFGIYRDFIYRKFDIGETAGQGRKFLADAFATTTFGTPLYTSLLYFMDYEPEQLAKASGSFFVYSLFISRPYGWFLDYFRTIFGLESASKTLKKEEELYEEDI